MNSWVLAVGAGCVGYAAYRLGVVNTRLAEVNAVLGVMRVTSTENETRRVLFVHNKCLRLGHEYDVSEVMFVVKRNSVVTYKNTVGVDDYPFVESIQLGNMKVLRDYCHKTKQYEIVFEVGEKLSFVASYYDQTDAVTFWGILVVSVLDTLGKSDDDVDDVAGVSDGDAN
jgi:hypothetical protein